MNVTSHFLAEENLGMGGVGVGGGGGEELNELRNQKLVTQNPWQKAKHAKLLWPTPGLKRRRRRR